jgi:hypothetical protein
MKISVELARIASDDSGIAFSSLERQEVSVSHPGLHPWNMYIDAQEKMYRQAFFQLPVDIKAVRLTVSVDYDEEDYVAFREFTVDLEKCRSEMKGIVG